MADKPNTYRPITDKDRQRWRAEANSDGAKKKAAEAELLQNTPPGIDRPEYAVLAHMRNNPDVSDDSYIRPLKSNQDFDRNALHRNDWSSKNLWSKIKGMYDPDWE